MAGTWKVDIGKVTTIGIVDGVLSSTISITNPDFRLID